VIDNAEPSPIIHPRDMDATLGIHVNRRIPPRGRPSCVIDALRPPGPAAVSAHLHLQTAAGAVADHIDDAPVGTDGDPRQLGAEPMRNSRRERARSAEV
jgi:hypothetical protein